MIYIFLESFEIKLEVFKSPFFKCHRVQMYRHTINNDTHLTNINNNNLKKYIYVNVLFPFKSNVVKRVHLK